MSPRVAQSIMIPILLLALLFYMFMMPQITPMTTNKVNIKGSSFNPPAEGDWIITQPIQIQNSTLTVNGSILIHESGNLTLDNVVLNFVGKRQHNLTVNEGGYVYIVRSQLTSTNVSLPFYLYAYNGSGLILTSSQLSHGILRVYTPNVSITRNNLTEGFNAALIGAPNCTIAENTFTSKGPWVLGCPGATISNNVFTNVFRVLEMQRSPFSQITNNEVINTTAKSQPSLHVVSSDSCIFTENTIVGDRFGVQLENNSDWVISKNNISANGFGLSLLDISHSTIENNILKYNNMSAISVSSLPWFPSSTGSVGNTFTGNIIHSNDYGVSFSGNCSENIFTRNSLVSNGRGITISMYCWENNFTWNTVTSNDEGIFLAEGCENNTFWGNTLSSNGYGVVTERGSAGNLFTLNNFMNNSVQARDYGDTIWDDGTYGNYWSDYQGEDKDLNGVGDTPYVIDSDSADRYPLMAPWFGGPIISPVILLVVGGAILIIVSFILITLRSKE